jgi:hypothetical protein
MNRSLDFTTQDLWLCQTLGTLSRERRKGDLQQEAYVGNFSLDEELF